MILHGDDQIAGGKAGVELGVDQFSENGKRKGGEKIVIYGWIVKGGEKFLLRAGDVSLCCIQYIAQKRAQL